MIPDPAWERFVEPWWLHQTRRLEAMFDPDGALPDDFLRWADDELDLFSCLGVTKAIYERYDVDREWLAGTCGLRPVDPPWGGLADHTDPPEWEPSGRDVSFTTIRSWYSICEGLVRLGITDVGSVVTWGGGFGQQSMALRDYIGHPFTEYVIDLPVMCAVQAQFLAHNLGADAVHLCEGTLQAGAVNLVPLPYVDLVPQGHDLFMALHSLNESTVAAQQYVRARDWFGAAALYLDYTQGIDLFNGTDHWMGIIEELRAEGRVP